MKNVQTAVIAAVSLACGLTTAGWAQDMYPNLAPGALNAYMSSQADGLSRKSMGSRSGSLYAVNGGLGAGS